MTTLPHSSFLFFLFTVTLSDNIFLLTHLYFAEKVLPLGKVPLLGTLSFIITMSSLCRNIFLIKLALPTFFICYTKSSTFNFFLFSSLFHLCYSSYNCDIVLWFFLIILDLFLPSFLHFFSFL